MAGKIPKRLYQVIILVLLVAAVGLMIHDITGISGIFAGVGRCFGAGLAARLFAFIVTLLAYFIPWFAIAMLLRRFSAMPTLSQELAGMEGEGAFEKMKNSYRQERSKLQQWKTEGKAIYYRRMAVAGFAVFGISMLCIAVIIFLFGWRTLAVVAEYKFGLALVLCPPIALVMALYFTARAVAGKRNRG